MAEFQLTNDNSLKYGDEIIELTYTESEIIRLLLSNRGNVVSAEEIFEKVWGSPYHASCSNTIMVHILNLRKKLEDNGKRPRILKTAWGKGVLH